MMINQTASSFPLGGILFWFLVILFVALLIGLLVKWATSSRDDGSLPRSSHSRSSQKEHLLNILNERYAQGDITKKEYDTKIDDLGL